MWVRRLIERMLAAEGRLIPADSDAGRHGLHRSRRPHGSNQQRSLAARARWSRRVGHGRRHPAHWPGPSSADAEPGAHIDVTVTIDGEQRQALLLGRRCHRRTARCWRSASSGLPSSRGGSAFMHALSARRPAARSPSPCRTSRCGSAQPRYVLLAGGIGITAIAGMARVLRNVKADYPLVYAGRSRPRDGLPGESGRAARRPARVHVGRRRHCRSDVDELLGGVDAGHRAVHVRTDPADGCGAPGLDATGRSALTTSASRPSATAAGSTRRSSSCASRGWASRPPSAPDESMLEALEAAGADMMFDCRKGECGLCEVRMLGPARAPSTTATCSTANASSMPQPRCAAASPGPSA